MNRASALLACMGLCGCQLVLGFEEHQLLVGGAAAGGNGPSGGAGGAGGNDDGGGPLGGAPTGFGTPDEIATGLGPLDAVALSGDDVYALEQGAQGHALLRWRLGSVDTLAGPLVSARGLVTAGDEVLTTHGPLDGVDPDCHVSAFMENARRDVMTEMCGDGDNSYYALAVAGDTVAASFLALVGNDHSDVRTAPLDGGLGTLIGLGEDEQQPVPSIAIGGGTFFWVDSQLDDVMTSAGEEVQGINNPPGNSVNRLAQGLTSLREVVVADGQVYVARADEVAQISGAGSAEPLGGASAPHGLAADSAIVVWAEAARVQAYLLGSGETVTLDDAADEPSDVALSPSFVVYVTAGGRIVQIPRM